MPTRTWSLLKGCVWGVLLMASPVIAQENRSITAIRFTGESPEIDGYISEEAWKAVPTLRESFMQMQPSAGQPAREQTEVQVGYDEDAIYVAMRMFDSAPDSISSQLLSRDSHGTADWAMVAFDSYYDHRTAFRFAVTAGGSVADVLHYDDNHDDASWNAVWDVATKRDQSGWTAEFRIPFSQLRFKTAGEGQEILWGVSFARLVARHNEFSIWPKMPVDGSRVVSAFGQLRGLKDLKAPKGVEILPYALGGITRAPQQSGNPFYRRNEMQGQVGADLKYGVTSNLTLNVTLNPDFGQVEADPSEINLTAFETFQRERRPFFVEGSNIFEFPISATERSHDGLFYSRRVGRAPQVRARGDYVDMPGSARILGAAKLSGKTSGGLSLGILSALTAEEHAQVSNNGQISTAPVEPMSSYSVVRVSQDFRKGQSAIGGVLTSTRRFGMERPEFAGLREQATTGGIDFRHRTGEGGQYQIKGYWVGSQVSGSEEAIDRTQRSPGKYFHRPEADHLTYDPNLTRLTGWHARVSADKVGGNNWRGGANLHVVSPGFEANDLGYQRSSDQITARGTLAYEESKKGAIFNRWRFGGSLWEDRTFGWQRMEAGAHMGGNAQLHNFWTLNVGTVRQWGYLATDELRGGPSLRLSSRTRVMAGVNSDMRKALTGGMFTMLMKEDEDHSYQISIRPEIAYRLGAKTQLSLEPSFSRTRKSTQYVATRRLAADTAYVLGDLEQSMLSFTTRLDYTLSPTLSLQAYVEPFLAAAKYDGYKEVQDPAARGLDRRFRSIPSGAVQEESGRMSVDRDGDGMEDYRFGRPDFRMRSLRSNLVMRWEYRPGSTVYLVWSQSRFGSDPRGDFQVRPELEELRNTPSTNVLMLKMNYWLGM